MIDTRADRFASLSQALSLAGFTGVVEDDSATRAAMSTDNSVYQITPDLIVSHKAADNLMLLRVLEEPEFAEIAHARGLLNSLFKAPD